ncbi:MAG: hypothetical protein GKR93_09200 [Gammaproteobacteria bacterium]|nr:hypothetical protein [Gammaproteobacteria bacterium]
MKNFLYSLLLSSILVAPVWSETDTSSSNTKDGGLKIELSMDDEADTRITEKELETKIKGKVFSIITDILEAAGDDISDEEKAEIKTEIKEAITEIKEEDEGTVIRPKLHIGDDDDSLEFTEAALGALAIFFIFGTPIMIIAAVLYASYRKKRLMHETINQYVASGKDIPPEVLQGLQKETAPKNNLHRGLIMSGLGLGIFLCFVIIGAIPAAALGLIPLFIGLAQLLIWKLENK